MQTLINLKDIHFIRNLVNSNHNTNLSICLLLYIINFSLIFYFI
ncbi:hypothetical protein CBC_A1075 [Clostridium botulinum C str. Eklund]|nr:hypothetical protein CBC_A1075 [Clostridium botulinum C str. Eklund]